MRTRVLIVDDHDGFRASARALLEAEGFAVVGEAADGIGALAAVERLRPDVVLLDVQLPDLDGFAVAERLAAAPDPPRVVLISSRDARRVRPARAGGGSTRLPRQARALRRVSRRSRRVVRTLRLALLPTAVALGLFAEWAALRRAPFEPAASTAEIRLAAADLAVGIVLVQRGSRRGGAARRAGRGFSLPDGLHVVPRHLRRLRVARVRRPRRLLLTLNRGLLAHTLLSYPNGRLERRYERAGVAAAYVLSVVGYVGETPAAALALAAVLVAAAQDDSFAPQAQTAARGARPSSHAPRWLRCSSRPRLHG